MLGVVENPDMTPADELMREVANDMGVGDTFRRTPVGVLFGDSPDEVVPDPFFGGAGPDADDVQPLWRLHGRLPLRRQEHHDEELPVPRRAGGGQGGSDDDSRGAASAAPVAGTTSTLRAPTEAARGLRKTITADQVVLAAGSLGTQRLLLRMQRDGHLPELSTQLGRKFRTNSEALLAVYTDTMTEIDHSKGVAITSSFFPEAGTHVEPVRYSKGSNQLLLLQSLLVDGDKPGSRASRGGVGSSTSSGAGPHRPRGRCRGCGGSPSAGFVVLVMQDRDNSLGCGSSASPAPTSCAAATTRGTRRPPGSRPAHEVVRRLAEKMDARAYGSWFELADIPAPRTSSEGRRSATRSRQGVIDPWHRVYGHPGLHVTDGAAVSANLGVNPSLTITAQAERAMSFWPNKGQDDPRPAVGADYTRVAPIEPKSPVVPADAPGALRLPVG